MPGNPEKDYDAFAQLARELYPELFRKAWKPIIKKSSLEPEDEDGSRRARFPPLCNITQSKFGGVTPWIHPTEGWPRCPKCHEKRTFLFQFHVGQMPAEIHNQLGRSSGLFQLFACQACTSNEDLIEADEFKASDHARIMNKKKLWEGLSLQCLAARAVLKSPKDQRRVHGHSWANRLPRPVTDLLDNLWHGSYYETHKNLCGEKIVLGWEVLGEELPNSEERDDFYDEITARMGLRTTMGLSCEIQDSRDLITSDVKLGGYISWMVCTSTGDGSQYPRCSKCKVEMNQPLFSMSDAVKVEEEEGVLFDWSPNVRGEGFIDGVGGLGFVVNCPKCKKVQLSWIHHEDF